MIVTEQDAKNKRCCGPDGCGDVKRGVTGMRASDERFCIGSECMGWIVTHPGKGCCGLTHEIT